MRSVQSSFPQFSYIFNGFFLSNFRRQTSNLPPSSSIKNHPSNGKRIYVFGIQMQFPTNQSDKLFSFENCLPSRPQIYKLFQQQQDEQQQYIRYLSIIWCEMTWKNPISMRSITMHCIKGQTIHPLTFKYSMIR